MSKRNDKLVELGKRLCKYAKSVGCKIEWKYAYIQDRTIRSSYLKVTASDSFCSQWESGSYDDTYYGTKKAYQDFANFVITVDPTTYGLNFGRDVMIALNRVMSASSANELDFKLSVLGF